MQRMALNSSSSGGGAGARNPAHSQSQLSTTQMTTSSSSLQGSSDSSTSGSNLPSSNSAVKKWKLQWLAETRALDFLLAESLKSFGLIKTIQIKSDKNIRYRNSKNKNNNIYRTEKHLWYSMQKNKKHGQSLNSSYHTKFLSNLSTIIKIQSFLVYFVRKENCCFCLHL